MPMAKAYYTPRDCFGRKMRHEGEAQCFKFGGRGPIGKSSFKTEKEMF